MVKSVKEKGLFVTSMFDEQVAGKQKVFMNRFEHVGAD